MGFRPDRAATTGRNDRWVTVAAAAVTVVVASVAAATVTWLHRSAEHGGDAGRLRAVIGTWIVVAGAIGLVGALGIRLRAQALALADSESARRSDQRLRRLVAASAELVVVVRASDGAITYLSPAAADILRLDPTALHRDTLLALVAEDDRQRVAERFDAVLEIGGSTRLECVIDAGGSPRQLDFTVSNHLDDPDIRGLVINATDVTERVTLTSNLSHQASHDSLTGLLNRQAFLERIDLAQAAGQPVAVVVVDLDGFKEVNDSLGHTAGDRVLTTAAARLATLVRQRDFVARLGGDEFAIGLFEPDTAGAEAVARRIITTMAAPIDTAVATEVLLTASVGIAVAIPGLDAATLLKRADAAMFEAKEAGRARFATYLPEMEARFAQRVEMRAAIERGLSNREFVLQYQPIHAIGTNHLVGFEALLRWQRSDGSFMNPGEFLPVAEASGQIIPLGRWVVHAAMRQLGIWRQLAPQLEMAINVSPRQLGEPGFVDEVKLLLDTHGLSPAAITFEVTETMLVDDPERTAARLRALKELGVHLAIDDYGAGNAAINFLLTFPIDVVKFDRGLVAALDEQPTPTEALIRSITSLAHSLELETVAEGIERPEQLAHVQALGCTKAQGYHLARPMFPDRAERYLLAHTGMTQR